MSSLANNYNRRKISFKYGRGSYLHSTTGKKYLDFIQGISVNLLGHSHPYLVKKLKEQANKLWHVSNAFTIPEGERLAKRLTDNTFANAVIFQNSGTECVETAIKFARRYFYSIGKPKKNRIICIKGSFHGRTIAAIAASGSKKMTKGFGPKSPGFDHFEFGNHKKLKKLINKNTAAIMIEPILGEGGCRVIPNWCLRGLRKLCDKKKILLIADEIQSGYFRSSKMFAFEHANIKPDIITVAKGIGGGFPIGAVLLNKKVAKCCVPGSHGSTYAGSPLAMSVANAVLDQVLKKNFLKKISKLSNYFFKELNKIKYQYPKIIKEVRGRGFLIGLQLNFEQSKFIKALEKNYLLTIRAADNTVRILPPLNVSRKEIDLALKIIKKVCKNYS